MIAATVLIYYYFGGQGAPNKQVVLLLMVYALALLMVSNVRYYSFKDIDLRTRLPFYALVGAIIAVVLVIAQPQILLFVALLAYVLSGPTGWLITMVRRRRQRAVRVLRRHAGGGAGETGA
jgi:CDP-diacylglycerol--serine O-phosphatidyltransferase